MTEQQSPGRNIACMSPNPTDGSMDASVSKVTALAEQWTHGTDGAVKRLTEAIEGGHRLDARDRMAIAVLLRAFEQADCWDGYGDGKRFAEAADELTVEAEKLGMYSPGPTGSAFHRGYLKRVEEEQRRASATPVGTSFDSFMREIEEEAKAQGPEAVAELETFRAYYSRLRKAVRRVGPPTAEASAAFASGPEISGGVDVEPEDDEAQEWMNAPMGNPRPMRAPEGPANVRMVDMEDKSVRLRFDNATEAEMKVWSGLLGKNVEVGYVAGMVRERRAVRDLIERHIIKSETGSMGGEEALSDLDDAIRMACHMASGVKP